MIVRKIFSNIFYELVTKLILTLIGTYLALKINFVEQMLTNLLKIINLENLISIHLLGILLLFLFFFIIFKIVNKYLKKPFYFKKHGEISWFIDKETGIVEDPLYCPKHHLPLDYIGNDEYYCQKCHNTQRKTKGELRRLYKEVSNLAKKKARNRNS